MLILELTVTGAVATTLPRLTVTVPVPLVVGEYNKPVWVIVPIVVVQVNEGRLGIGLPNWSATAAVNCSAVPVDMLTGRA